MVGQLQDQLKDKEDQVVVEGKSQLEELAKKIGGTALNCREWVSIAQDAETALKTVEERVSGEIDIVDTLLHARL